MIPCKHGDFECLWLGTIKKLVLVFMSRNPQNKLYSKNKLSVKLNKFDVFNLIIYINRLREHWLLSTLVIKW